MTRRRVLTRGLLFTALVIAASTFARASNDPTPDSHIEPQKVRFKSDGLSLTGFLYKPQGRGRGRSKGTALADISAIARPPRPGSQTTPR